MDRLIHQGGVVIFNPAAGRGHAARIRAEAQAHLGDAWEWRPTARAGHAEPLAREAAKTAQIVVAFGGDGTVGDVARGLFGSEAALGILPAGTGNDAARNLKISLEMREACAILLAGQTRRVDMGTLNDRPFINNGGLGFDAAVMQTMNTAIRKFRGRPAFILAVLKMLPAFRPFRLTITADDDSPETLSAMMVSVLNGPVYGAGMQAAPGASLEDGKLDMMVIRAMPKLKLLALFPKVMAGQHLQHPAVLMKQVRRVRLDCVPPQPLNIDGDVHPPAPAEIQVRPQCLSVLVP